MSDSQLSIFATKLQYVHGCYFNPPLIEQLNEIGNFDWPIFIGGIGITIGRMDIGRDRAQLDNQWILLSRSIVMINRTIGPTRTLYKTKVEKNIEVK